MPLVAGRDVAPSGLTGRLSGDPSALLREEVLEPQFGYELAHLLPHYLAIERVLVAEYLRLGLISDAEAGDLRTALDEVTAEGIAELRDSSLSDIAFAVERLVEERLPRPIPVWHVDRSRNDLQSCAQLLFCRAELIETARTLHTFGETAHALAGRTLDLPMPGYTHYQAAQIITPGFYFAAVSDQVLHSLRRLLATYDGLDACPLGAGAMAGQELAWDRESMAGQLGFRRVEPLALTSVASRSWVAEVTADLSLLGAALSRFCTDLLTWSGSGHGFVDLPDELAGISSAMPQKKNFPILERIRGRTGHLAAFHLDVLLGQRNTPFANLVEVSKEAGSHLSAAFGTCRSALRLFTAVLAGVRFDAERMARLCRQEYFGAFSLANALTLTEGVPWRRAQVIAGGYVVAALDAGLAPARTDPELLRQVAAGHGVRLTDPGQALADAFDVPAALRRMTTAGATGPDAVAAVLAGQRDEFGRLRREWAHRQGGESPDGEPGAG